MRPITRLITMLAGFLAGPAMAADLPSRSFPTAPLPSFVKSHYVWTGAYVGVHAGYHAGNGRIGLGSGTDTFLGGLGTYLGLGAIPTVGARRPSGFLGGAQVGYNYQMDRLLIGVEADFSYVNGQNRVMTVLGHTTTADHTTITKTSMQYFGTLRARAGFVHHRTLFYLTGGAAFANSRGSVWINGPDCIPPLHASGAMKTNWGWTFGGGIEHAISKKWTVKAEYLYYDLGKSSRKLIFDYTVAGVPGVQTSSLTANLRHTGSIFRVGLNYHFGSPPKPVVASY